MMNSIPCSKRVVVFVVVAVALAGAVGTATAVTVANEDVPTEKKVDTMATATVTVNDLYTDAPSEWTLRAESNLTGDITWQISKSMFGNAGIENESGAGQTYETSVSRNDDVKSVTITVSGTVPNRTEYTYEPRQNISAVTLYRVTGDGKVELGTAAIEYYTEKSKTARQAINAAKQAIQAAGGDADAEQDLRSAIEFYNNGDFNDAIRVANNAEDKATSAKQTSTLIMFGGIGVVLVALVVGGVYVYRQRQDDYDKLR